MASCRDKATSWYEALEVGLKVEAGFACEPSRHWGHEATTLNQTVLLVSVPHL